MNDFSMIVKGPLLTVGRHKTGSMLSTVHGTSKGRRRMPDKVITILNTDTFTYVHPWYNGLVR